MSQSVQCENILHYFSMVVSSLWIASFKFSVFMECSIELSEMHLILDETARYPNYKLFLISVV